MSNPFKSRKIKFLIFIYLGVIFFVNLNGQPPYPYKFSYEIDSIFSKDSTPFKFDQAAWDYSFIGNDSAALRVFKMRNQGRSKPLPQASINYFTQEAKSTIKDFAPIPAKDFILKKAKDTRIIIINEAHHDPRHRAFVESLLADLAKLGYDHIGIEALNNFQNSQLDKSDYPKLSSGYYLKEPRFASLIRTALKFNYRPFPYEDTSNANGMDRELHQAQNIKKIFDKNSNHKFIIYCGFGHVEEDSIRNGWVLAMAGRLKQLTGIDPLTIDQVALTQKEEFDTPASFLRGVINLKYPAVLVDKKGKAFNRVDENSTYDVNIYHPNTSYKYGRPDWLITKGKTAVNIKDKLGSNYPYLVLAYYHHEGSDAVPADIIEVRKSTDPSYFILPKKRQFTIVTLNHKKQESKFVIKVK